jgi:hypothetical protein
MIQVTNVCTTPEHEAKFGKWGQLPPNFKSMTEKEFAQSHFFSYSPTSIEHRQAIIPGGKTVSSLKLYFYHDDTGIAITNNYWEGKVLYFRFAVCEHEWREMGATEALAKGHRHYGNCYHITECTKCQTISGYDSSD